MRILITGGCGFIGSHLVRHLINQNNFEVLNLDALTYAGNEANLSDIQNQDSYSFVNSNIRDRTAINEIFSSFRPNCVFHLAAETHVDRSIDSPDEFIQTNVVGTSVLIEEADRWRNSLSAEERDTFRFVHISTDEVYGSLESGSAKPFVETSPLNPNSPYAASKAAADHLVRAWFKTYGLPTITVNCTNNYGPYQFPEKLIPMIIVAALEGKAIPIYGQGENLREWIYVEDFAQAIFQLSQKGVPGETYNIGSGEVIPNIEIAHKVCDIMDKLESKSEYLPHRDLIEFVEDRPGHDFCYAINSTKARNLLSWQPKISLDDGLQRTVSWYLANQNWWAPLREKKYSGARLGQLPSAKLVQ